ncbi:UNVERIFIED_CONTAM: hypothetical protein Scaly_2623900 [Sesamum calycinum]|uniref:Uncharacterized protein n=1 Tax=Sesamum calycinum TaxID=2727403 RepID=A0AAW2JBI1_9LAMI
MSEFDIKFVTKKVVKGRAVAEFLAQQPIDDDQEWSLEFPDEHLRSITVQGWRMYFDGASNKAGAGIGVIIVTPHQNAAWEGPARSKIKPLVLLYSEDPCYEKKQEPVMVATVEEKPWFYDVQKYLQDREYPDHPLTRQSSETLGFDSYTKFNPSDTSPPRMVPLPLPKESSSLVALPTTSWCSTNSDLTLERWEDYIRPQPAFPYLAIKPSLLSMRAGSVFFSFVQIDTPVILERLHIILNIDTTWNLDDVETRTAYFPSTDKANRWPIQLRKLQK